MAYDFPRRHVYMFDAHSFASADRAIILKNPLKGSRGKLMSVDAMVTTTCAGATTKPIIKVGTTVGGAELFTMNLGTTAGGAVMSSREYGTVLTTAATGAVTSAYSTTAGILGNKSLVPTDKYVVGASDADLYVTLVAATGGGAAGVADVKIEVEWM